MKNVFIYIVFLLVGLNSFAQNGVDVIFLLDNSYSISNTQFSQIQTSVSKLMTEVVKCNPRNKVTVAQYGTDGLSKLFISSNFGTASYGFMRAYQSEYIGGNLTSSMYTLTQALHGIPYSGITSTQKNLTRTPGNSLVVYIFTNAQRPYDLISGAGSSLGQDISFEYYTDFKDTFAATIMVSLVADVDPTAIPAAASVASKGGSYNGSIEGYPSDPDGQGAIPRYLLVKDNFALSNPEIQKITEDICSVAQPHCVNSLILKSPEDNLQTAVQDNRQAQSLITASNVITYNGGVAIYHANDTVLLTSGFHSQAGSRFRGYIQECTDQFVGKRVAVEEQSVGFSTFEKESGKELFTFYPNPAVTSITITSGEVLQNIIVTSLDGFTLFQGDIKSTSYELNVSNFIKGIYVITVTAETGEQEVKKLIKN